jgi:hypothetical protein
MGPSGLLSTKFILSVLEGIPSGSQRGDKFGRLHPSGLDGCSKGAEFSPRSSDLCSRQFQASVLRRGHGQAL